MSLSRLEKTKLDGFEFFVKRDDLLGDLCGGNKARKLKYFIKNAKELRVSLMQELSHQSSLKDQALQAHNFKLGLKSGDLSTYNFKQALKIGDLKARKFKTKLSSNFKQELATNTSLNLKNFTQKIQSKTQPRIISFGSSQSNCLAVLSEFARKYDFELIFVCKQISSFLKDKPCGNYALALKNEAKIIQSLNSSLKAEALALCEKGDLFIPEGLACKEAEMGFESLAREIKEQAFDLNLQFNIFLPSGTGTSALYLAKHSEFRVFTCACVGDEAYLKRQMLDLKEPLCIEILDPSDEGLKNSVKLNDTSCKKLFILKKPKNFHFAKPYKELLAIYKKALFECGIEFSLLYDTVGLGTMLFYRHLFARPMLYVHQGGVSGNASMLERYKFNRLL
ncbi:1-aminocyclopropane-1-carboxylate deaminase/D-cysteine desulfhydrase [Campylobacter troglodytis]|uniref:1-aminocyclopropane-1-carboxylate deaminase/D-cysteine desulfhydrase n=1 Tax=Campylobacter troglodytis TaxID=654363 RepID=UPI00115B78F5|nr:1-aminocyclopropane-1-carboxylate deaminase/D-cysteine desulfhydrase [Campylobacter troglodytis]TQR61410.1 1-aminocyclopropane-1-carboxylate deaminase [Campylobacter troglodytis]